MPNKNAPRKIWRHVGGEGGYSYLDDMNAKELADLEVLNRNYERIAAADAACHQKCFDYYEQKQREEQAKKFDLRLRIGVFFDGTLITPVTPLTANAAGPITPCGRKIWTVAAKRIWLIPRAVMGMI